MRCKKYFAPIVAFILYMAIVVRILAELFFGPPDGETEISESKEAQEVVAQTDPEPWPWYVAGIDTRQLDRLPDDYFTNNSTSTITQETVASVAVEAAPTLVDLGEFEVTYYCPCVKCCGKTDGITATGTHATPGRTIAVDPEVIPLGSVIVVDGHEYIAEDIGGLIKGNKIDIFCSSHQEAINAERHMAKVEIMKW